MTRTQQKLPGRWAGKTACVIGASDGLGLALAQCLARQGVKQLFLVARRPERLQAIAAQLAAAHPGVQVQSYAADVATAAGAAGLAAAIAGARAQLDLVVNAVGLSDRGTALQLTTERLDELMRANVHAPLLATQALVPQLARSATLVYIGSLSSYLAPRFLGGYALAKHALRALTQQLRLELCDQGLHVMLACPGPIARVDSGSRYAALDTVHELPAAALQGGGGAKIAGLDPDRLADEILTAAHQRKLELVRPRKVRWLLWLMALCPAWGEACLKRFTA